MAGPVPVPGRFGPAPVIGPVGGGTGARVGSGRATCVPGTVGAKTVAGCWSLIEPAGLGCSAPVGGAVPAALRTGPVSRPPPSVTSGGSTATGREGSLGPGAVDWPITGPIAGLL